MPVKVTKIQENARRNRLTVTQRERLASLPSIITRNTGIFTGGNWSYPVGTTDQVDLTDLENRLRIWANRPGNAFIRAFFSALIGPILDYVRRTTFQFLTASALAFARFYCPVDTGALRKSLRIEIVNDNIHVASPLDYYQYNLKFLDRVRISLNTIIKDEARRRAGEIISRIGG